MTDELAKTKVLAVYPDAWLGGLTFDPTKKVFSGPINKPRECKELGLGQTEEAAWQNAAESLPAAPEQKVCRHCGLPIRKTGMDRVRNEWEHLDGMSYCKGASTYAWPVAPVGAKEKVCPQCGNDKDDPRPDSIERMLVCGDSFHVAEPKPTPSEPKLEYQKEDVRTFSTLPESSFGAHIKEAGCIHSHTKADCEWCIEGDRLRSLHQSVVEKIAAWAAAKGQSNGR